MRTLLVFAAAAALIVASGACGSIIPIPDQGVVVLGCASPSSCFLANCSCIRADVSVIGKCITTTTCTNPLDNSTCTCPATTTFTVPDIDMAGNRDMKPPQTVIQVATQCMETVQACVGRGVFCGGTGARCLAGGQSCSGAGGDPPQLVAIASGSIGPSLEPHCEFVDDVCCAGSVDAGARD